MIIASVLAMSTVMLAQHAQVDQAEITVMTSDGGPYVIRSVTVPWIEEFEEASTDPVRRSTLVGRLVPLWAAPCLGDWDGDGAQDNSDLVEFLRAFGMRSVGADLNRDGAHTAEDFLVFMNAWVRGCP